MSCTGSYINEFDPTSRLQNFENIGQNNWELAVGYTKSKETHVCEIDRVLFEWQLVNNVANNEVGIRRSDFGWPSGRNVDTSETAVGVSIGHFLHEFISIRTCYLVVFKWRSLY